MTTVGEFKKKLEGLPETAPLEFWAILEKGLVELVLNPNEGIRFPRESVAEVVLAPSALRINRDKKNQRLKPPAEVANITPAEAAEWARRGRTAWLRAELRKLSGWLPIETAPQDGTVFLGYRDGKVREACRVPRDDCEMWVFGGQSGSTEFAPQLRPTHWMALPDSP